MRVVELVVFLNYPFLVKNMKVVIESKCESFKLSPKALKRYAQLKGEECNFYKSNFLHGQPPVYELIPEEDYTKYGQSFRLGIRSGTPGEKEIEFWSDCAIDRTDPHLIQVIEELGEDVNFPYSGGKIKIVEIPDDVEYYIIAVDGCGEEIHEEHRVWY